ncbi:hypothetical protein LO772_04295 [Yinghuangia sp. ASG 101]|uniref:hypothetical protein n=1 Tax=Yinghuangia sp. ASG 101 TaxID=2896848 RepID=UPI001E4BD215|nr:hypothetical protein [Yinghuangia sp. ASG 101]UGQ12850.1 hypothetical protein LO772_04295 [Yinghuangia sp. ASG 101]
MHVRAPWRTALAIGLGALGAGAGALVWVTGYGEDSLTEIVIASVLLVLLTVAAVHSALDDSDDQAGHRR